MRSITNLRNRRAGIGAAVLSLCLSPLVTGQTRGAGAPAETAAAQHAATDHARFWPFDPLSPAALRRSPRKLVSHFHAPFPTTLSNKPEESDYYTRGWLIPDGEAGKHKNYGGYLRQRPYPGPPAPEPDWGPLRAVEDVRNAIAIGMDAMILNFVTPRGGNFYKECAFVMLSPWGANFHPAPFWREVLPALKAAGIEVAFVPCAHGSWDKNWLGSVSDLCAGLMDSAVCDSYNAAKNNKNISQCVHQAACRSGHKPFDLKMGDPKVASTGKRPTAGCFVSAGIRPSTTALPMIGRCFLPGTTRASSARCGPARGIYVSIPHWFD